jgi:hypothetical protein
MPTHEGGDDTEGSTHTRARTDLPPNARREAELFHEERVTQRRLIDLLTSSGVHVTMHVLARTE